MLSTTDHSRDKAGLTYVYPVLSRRSGGLSIGINLNINNACNWRCIYCQVPDLIRGSAPPVDLHKLASELRYFLTDIIHGEFYEREKIPVTLQTIKDIAISGNGEPTTASEFDQVIDTIKLIMDEFGLSNETKCVLITNGSQVNREHIKRGIKKLGEINGEIWFKVDSATATGIAKINQIRGSNISNLKRLKVAAELCPTWIQTCFFEFEGNEPDATEVKAYLKLIQTIIDRNIPVKGIMLYGVERKSMQPESEKIKKLSAAWYEDLVSKLNTLPLIVKLSP